MKKFLFVLLSLFLLGLSSNTAHAAGCTGSAQCVSAQYFGGTGSDVTSSSVAYAPNNTAGNTLLAWAYINCSNTGAAASLGFSDANGNAWNATNLTIYESPTSGNAFWFGWAMSINSGVNTLTASVLGSRTDCKVIGGTFEYAGLVPWNPGSPVMSTSSAPIFNSAGSFPITSQVYNSGSPPAATSNLYIGMGLHDTGNTGTWSVNSGWSTIGGINGSGTSQMEFWDATSGPGPSSLVVGNTGGSSYTTNFVLWMEMNRSTTPPSPPVSGGCQSSASGTGTTASCSFAYQPGDFNIFMVGGEGVLPSITAPTTSGCPSNWSAQTYSAQGGTSNEAGFYLQVFTGSGTCTVTETLSSSPTYGFVIIDINTSGLPAYSLDNLGNSPTVGSSFSCSITGQATANNDLLIGFITDGQNSSSGNVYGARGWTFLNSASTTNSGGGVVAAAYRLLAGPAGPQTFSGNAVGSSGGNPVCVIFALRQIVPTLGFQQGGVVSSASATSVSVPFLYPSAAGHHIRVAATSYQDNATYTLSIPSGPTCIQGPSTWDTGQGRVTTWDCPVISSFASPLTINMNGSASNRMSLMAWEVAGLAPNHWWVSSTAQAANVGCPSSGSLYLYNNGTYYLDSVVGSTFSSASIAGSSGWITRLVDGNGGNVTLFPALFDQVAGVPGGSPTTFSNTITPTTSNGCGVGLWAFDTVPYLNLPQAVQTPINQGTGSVVTQFNEPTGGCSLVEAATADEPVALSINSVPSLSWTLLQGGGTNVYGLWVANNVPSGSIAVTVANGNLQTLGVKVCNVNSVTGSAGASANADVVGPISLTTAGGDSQYLLTCYMASGAIAGSQPTLASSTNWVLKQWNGRTAGVGTQCWDYPNSPSGTYSVTYTSNTGQTAMSGIILSMTISSSYGTSQQGNVVAVGNTTQQ